jgi:pyruvate formate lyase activating enzyme
MTVEEVFDAVRRDKMFYDTSGGGVTVSGGEPLLKAPFVKTLFELCKNAGINTCIETAGFVNSQSLLMVLPLTDYVLYDIKHLDSDRHKAYTGQFNELILKNAKLAADSGAHVLFRIPLIPTINDDEENIKNTAAFLKSICSQPEVQLMPYHRMGESKYKALNKQISALLRDVQVMDQSRLEEVKLKFVNHGVKCSISK